MSTSQNAIDEAHKILRSYSAKQLVRKRQELLNQEQNTDALVRAVIYQNYTKFTHVQEMLVKARGVLDGLEQHLVTCAHEMKEMKSASDALYGDAAPLLEHLKTVYPVPDRSLETV